MQGLHQIAPCKQLFLGGHSPQWVRIKKSHFKKITCPWSLIVYNFVCSNINTSITTFKIPLLRLLQYHCVICYVVSSKPVPDFVGKVQFDAVPACTYSLYLDDRALDNSSFLLIVQNLVGPEQNGLSHSKIVPVSC